MLHLDGTPRTGPTGRRQRSFCDSGPKAERIKLDTLRI